MLDDDELAMLHEEGRLAEARQLAEWVRDNPDQAPIVTFPWEVPSTSDPAVAFARGAAFGSSYLIVEPEPTHDHLALLRQMHDDATSGRSTVGPSAEVLALSCAIQEIDASRQRLADFEDNWGRAKAAIARRDQWLREAHQRVEDLVRGIDDALKYQSFLKLYDLVPQPNANLFEEGVADLVEKLTPRFTDPPADLTSMVEEKDAFVSDLALFGGQAWPLIGVVDESWTTPPTAEPEYPCSVGWSFTFERGRGLVWNASSRGCPVYYLDGDAYQRAFTEAEDYPWSAEVQP